MWVTIGLLATLGVLVTAAITALAAHYFLHLSWVISFLLAAVIASTDPATLIPVFKRVPIKDRVQQAAETESAFNDATGAILTMTVLGIILGTGHMVWWHPLREFGLEAVVGLFIGALTDFLAIVLVAHRRWGVFHEFGSIVMLVAALASYAGATALDGSGFMAAFTAGILVGNAPSINLPFAEHTQHNIEHFGNAITLIKRMLIFVLVGTQVDFSVVLQYLWRGLAVILVFIFIARPLCVLSSLLPDRRANWQWNEIGFLFWVRETGVIPAALSGMLLGQKVPYADVIAAITFLAILFQLCYRPAPPAIWQTGWA